jgi:hypothetical protein
MSWSNPQPIHQSSAATQFTNDETINKLISKMAGDNPGAINVCRDIISEAEEIDPNSIGGLGILMQLDVLGIHSGRIWILYRSVCGQNLVKLFAVMRASQLGLITNKSIIASIDRRDPLDTDAILAAVRSELGTFGGSGPELPKSTDDRIISLD